MKRLVVTIAVGDKKWGQLALNLCLSIKASDPDMEVALIHDEFAIKGIEPLVEQFFNHKGLQWPFKDPIRHAFQLKTELYSRFPDYDEILFLDADSIMLPGRKVSELFDQQKDREFTMYCNDIFDYSTGTRSRKGHTFFCDAAEAMQRFALDKPLNKVPPFLPQTDGSFIYFKRGYTAQFIFKIAQDVYNDADFKTEHYKGAKLSEVCFNVACAKAGVWPAERPVYRPLFMEAFSGYKDFNFILNEYPAFCIAGVNPPSANLVHHYNKLSDFYRDYHGVSASFKYEIEQPKKPVPVAKKQRPIFGFWHVAMMGLWEEIVKEQLEILNSSGLFKSTEKIFLIAVGATAKNIKTLKAIIPASISIIAELNGSLDKYEFPTLSFLHHHSLTMPPHYGWYIHTKGVSDPRGKHWRDYMNYYNIEKWKDAQAKIIEGYDLCGVKLLHPNGHHPLHYSGNFFHFDSDYIKTLASPMELDTTNRHSAEMWVCSAEPNAASLCQLIIDHEQKPLFK